MAVSYTHLDVYKRQILLSAGFEKLFLFALDKAVGAVLGEEEAQCCSFNT